MRSALAVLTCVLCGCTLPRPLLVRAVGQGHHCTVRVNDVEMSADALDRERLRMLAKAHHGRMIVDTDPNTPYRCIGGAVYNLQRAGFQIVGVTVNGVPLPNR